MLLKWVLLFNEKMEKEGKVTKERLIHFMRRRVFDREVCEQTILIRVSSH